MLLKIVHQTDLKYSELISESVMELRMVPRQEQDQHRLSFELSIGPAAGFSSYFDWMGNTVHTFSINPAHQHIRIVASSVVETDRPHIEPERFQDTWPLPANPHDYWLYDYLQFGGPIVDSLQLRELVDLIQPRPGMATGELALRMLHLIDEKFAYKTGVTNAASPITEILATGYGVCQDFTHLMIGLARVLQIPARYVSGFVHPRESEFRGYTQTHAWCELLFPSAGWIGFDPTNRCVVGGNFVKVAVGRDFRDVPPNRGVYRGVAKEKIEVLVKSDELAGIPRQLAAERFGSLELPMDAAAVIAQRQHEAAAQQGAQQQQTRLRSASLPASA